MPEGMDGATGHAAPAPCPLRRRIRGIDMEITKKAVTETNTPEETFALGKKIGQKSISGQVYTLIGDLGVGKTVFTQGFAEGLGVGGPVNSPTFTILQVYEEGRIPFYHFDVYRISDVEEMEEIGYEDCFYGNGVCLIEWANLIEEILPEQYYRVTIEKNLEKGFDYRRITIESIFPTAVYTVGTCNPGKS